MIFTTNWVVCCAWTNERGAGCARWVPARGPHPVLLYCEFHDPPRRRKRGRRRKERKERDDG